MVTSLTIVFTAKEILDQIHRELTKLNVDTEKISVEKWKLYIIARAIEDVLLISLTPLPTACMENIASVVRSNYRRRDGEELYTLHQDVGSKLFPYLSSNDLSFESELQLYRNRFTICARTST